MKSQIVKFFALVMLGACNGPKKSGITQKCTSADYQVGEKWIWRHKGITTKGEVRSEGKDTREIVSFNGILGMTIGNDTIPVTDIIKSDESETPKYDWPLEVGNKWKHENNWTSQDGTKGKQSQNKTRGRWHQLESKKATPQSEYDQDFIEYKTKPAHRNVISLAAWQFDKTINQ